IAGRATFGASHVPAKATSATTTAAAGRCGRSPRPGTPERYRGGRTSPRCARVGLQSDTARDTLSARLPAPELQSLLGRVDVFAPCWPLVVVGPFDRGVRLQLACHGVQVGLAALEGGGHLAQPPLLLLELDLALA